MAAFRWFRGTGKRVCGSANSQVRGLFVGSAACDAPTGNNVPPASGMSLQARPNRMPGILQQLRLRPVAPRSKGPLVRRPPKRPRRTARPPSAAQAVAPAVSHRVVRFEVAAGVHHWGAIGVILGEK